MQRIRLIHWKESEAEEKVEFLKKAGYMVDSPLLDKDSLRQMREDPPNAFVIDLDRVPSQGRDFALGIRIHKATRTVPLVFVGGEAEKVSGIKKLLPDAVYTQWDQLDGPLKQAIDSPPVDPVVPASVMAAYAGAPLSKKLGIKENAVVALVNAPKGIDEILGELPEGAILGTGLQSIGDLTLWFVRSRAELEKGMGKMFEFGDVAGLWIIWPKKSSGMESDLTQTIVRQIGLASGLVDFKISAIDETWSGLRFTKRKIPQQKG
ncbi:MAG: hypothetical protein MUO58_05570 [Anaerolineales bacterium]|nr:hypothetical protein [Anaerolineales bacterium]